MVEINKSSSISYLLFLVLALPLSCSNPSPDQNRRPNIVLIMADDLGYECLGAYGGLSYQTPVLDSLASNGMLFAHCVSQPLCTPSRIKLMTGLYNYRNYDLFGYLSPEQYTFGNLMKEAGYKTCIAGKWQLNGILDEGTVESADDNTTPNKFGFDEYCLWRLVDGESLPYLSPKIEVNGKIEQSRADSYGPDIFSDYVVDFIRRNKKNEFFVYYPMVLPHKPLMPTPKSKAWEDQSLRNQRSTVYFKDMVEYIDFIAGKIIDELKELKLDQNTILIFTSDNGTQRSIVSKTRNGEIRGGKGRTTAAGTHVPLIVYWPGKISPGSRYDGLIEFSDFFPTFSEISGNQKASDGKSFYPLLTGASYEPRKTAYVFNKAKFQTGDKKYRHQFARTVAYKLYRDGRFYNLENDLLENHELNPDSLSVEEQNIKSELEAELQKHPG